MTKNGRLILAVLLGIGLTLFLFFYREFEPDQSPFSPETGMTARVRGKNFEIRKGDDWVPLEIKGVNMGSSIPGAFPNEGRIDEETYFRWFQWIGQMNANTVRVYQLHPPEFYTALCRYNEEAEEPIYLIQTMDLSENIMFSHENLLDPAVHQELFQETCDVVNAVHGDLIRLKNGDLQYYGADASDYVLGYLLGIEWDELFVDFLCRMNPGLPAYQGRFLAAAENATPFESFLAQWGDTLLSFEMDRYQDQKMITFCNWPDTDPFHNEFKTHITRQKPGEPDLEMLVDAEHIHGTNAYEAGVFAAYNVYPYYPLFLQHGPYTFEADENGVVNPYLTYLTKLTDYHTIPVLISEYGAPSSRDKAHDDVWLDRTHGKLSETEQAEVVLSLYRDIRKAGCAGSLLFSWQDEWYKRTWNEKMISDPDGRASWSNTESAEQFFGLLSFDPGDGSVLRAPDGDLSEWDDSHRLTGAGKSENGPGLSMQSDEKYVYFLVDGYDPRKGVTIALDLLPGSGLTEFKGQKLDRNADFILSFEPEQAGQLLVHDDYNLLLHSMSNKPQAGSVQAAVESIHKHYPDHWLSMDRSDDFHVVQRAGGSVFSYIRQTLDINSVGVLKEGNGNPEAADYDSNADYHVSGSNLEIRIPWQLLNFRDPSQCIIVDDLFENKFTIQNRKIDAIYASVYTDLRQETVKFAPYELTGWNEPTWHERLKPAYYTLQQEFKGVN